MLGKKSIDNNASDNKVFGTARLRNNKFIVIIVSLVLLIILAVGAYLLINRSSDKETPDQAINYEQNAEELMSKGNIDESVDSYDKAIESSKTDQEKADLIIKKASKCSNTGTSKGYDCMKEALDQYDALVGPDYRSLIPRGFILMTENNKTEAKTLLTKAVEELNAKGSLTDEQQKSKVYAEGLLKNL